MIIYRPDAVKLAVSNTADRVTTKMSVVQNYRQFSIKMAVQVPKWPLSPIMTVIDAQNGRRGFQNHRYISKGN